MMVFLDEDVAPQVRTDELRLERPENKERERAITVFRKNAIPG